jgi:type II secretory pathway predicted ATPase ExeA
MFLRYFGLNDDPFGVTPEPRYLYQSRTHREALASLKCGFYGNRGFTALIAPPGLGKTTLLHRFLGDIGESARSVFLFDLDEKCEPRELIRSILRDLGITPANTSNEMHEQLNGILVEEARKGRVVAVVIDEAQNLSEAALETVRLLSNFETTRAKLIHIVLAGQPQLSDKLMQPSLLQLRQRVTTICRIDPLSAQEACAYIDHRLQMAGHSGEPLFTSDALNLIAQASLGIPRTINNLCFNALSICRALNKKQVVASMVEEAIADSQLIPHAKEVASIPALPPADIFHYASKPEGVAALARPWKIAAAAVLAVSMLGALGYLGSRLFRYHDVSAVRSVDSKALTASASVPDSVKSEKTSVTATAPRVERFQVKVERHQTLRDIAVRYLGEFNESTLRQICALNPKLINPNHVEAGQKIWLPGPPAPNMAESAVNSTEARNLP